MKITKSYLKRMIKKQVDLVMEQRYGPASETSAVTLASMMPANSNQAEALSRDQSDTSQFHAIMTAINDISTRKGKLMAIKKALETSNKLTPEQQKAVYNIFAASPAMRQTNLQESKKPENEIILEAHRKGRNVSPAVKKLWWLDA